LVEVVIERKSLLKMKLVDQHRSQTMPLYLRRSSRTLVTVEDFVVISARELLATNFHWQSSDGC